MSTPCDEHSFEIFIDHRKHLIIYGVVILKSLTMTKVESTMYSSYNIRDFGQLLNSLYSHLWHLVHGDEMANKQTQP